jgi:16S rRNA (adenine(1408)-N(1))-methyltransferase
VTIDVGTGDGRAVLAAAGDPRTLAIGMDANAAAMAELSRRAARPRKGGVANALFVRAAAETPPTELAGVADVVTVQFPWGSLLRGCLGADPVVAQGIVSLVAPGGTLELLLAPASKDGLDGLPVGALEIIAATSAAFLPFGLDLKEGRTATGAEVRASGSTWARRLGAAVATGAAADRPVTFARLLRSGRR